MALELSLGSFYGIDTAFDFLIFLVAVLIYYQSNKVYKIIKEKKYFYFSWAFFSIAVAFLFKILTNVTIANRVIINHPNFIVQLLVESRETQVIYFFSFMLYKIFLLTGYLLLFLVAKKISRKEDAILLIYLGIVAVFFSIYFNFIFHLTIVVILSYLTAHFYENHKINKSRNSWLVFSAFLIILVSHVTFLFDDLHWAVYLVAEILVFIGFLTLLLNHLKTNNGKKKNKARGYQRPLRSSEER